MRKLIIYLVTILSILLISVTGKAAVRDTQDIAEPLAALGLDWKAWLLIEDKTLRQMEQEASAYRMSEELLKGAQTALDQNTAELNKTRNEKHAKEVENYELKKRVMDLENVQWYEHPGFWAAVGAAGGAIIVVIIAASLR